MAREKVLLLQQHHVQWLEDFASKLEKLTIFTIIFLPKYTLLCALSFFLSTTLYRFCYGLHVKHGLKPSDKEYYERMFCVERVAMFFLAMRDHTSWGCLLWSLGLALFGCSYASDLSNKGLLSHKDLMRTTINNDPRLNPRLQQGYIFWLERVTVIIVAAVPFNYLVGHYYYLAFGLFLVPAILSYILKPENNSKDDAKGLVKETENREVESEIKCYALIQNHLFWLERVAILGSILFSSGRELLVIASGAFHLVFSFARHGVSPSPIDLDLVFWVERAATIFLSSAYGSNESSLNWYIAVVLFAITNTLYFINPIQHMLQILGSLLKDCAMFEGIENEFEENEDEEEKEENHAERLEKLEVEIKKLRSENNDLKRERSLWAQELERVTEENEQVKGLTRETEDSDDLKRERSFLAKELERITEENEELKGLMREREDRELRDKSMWAQELERIIEDHEHLERLMRERENDLIEMFAWTENLGRIIEDFEEHKRVTSEREDNDLRERASLGQELDRITEENEEHKRLMREREEIWDERFDAAKAEHSAEKQALVLNYQTLLGEKKALEAELEEALMQAKVASASREDVVASAIYNPEETRDIDAMLEVVAGWFGIHKGGAAEEKKDTRAGELRRWWEEELAESERLRARLLALEGTMAELKEEIRKLEGKCELYRNLLHDQDLYSDFPMLKYFYYNYDYSPYYYYYYY